MEGPAEPAVQKTTWTEDAGWLNPNPKSVLRDQWQEVVPDQKTDLGTKGASARGRP
jgi:hypothetical protein